MLGQTVKDLTGSLAARLTGQQATTSTSSATADTMAPDASRAQQNVQQGITSNAQKAATEESTGTGTGTGVGKTAHAPEVDAVIIEVYPNADIDPELLRLQIKAIQLPRTKIGEVRIQLDEPVRGRALLTVAVQVTDPQDQTLEKVKIALQNVQVGNRGGVSSVELQAFTKVVF